MFDNEFKLFQRSGASIWTDDYISESMLQAHLDESTDGASRKSFKRSEMINFIQEWTNSVEKDRMKHGRERKKTVSQMRENEQTNMVWL